MIILLRHGQSANNASEEHLRVCDPDLTDLGRQQAAQTGEHLAAMPITHIYCSPFLRSLETARPIARFHPERASVHIHPHIFEQGGCYSGYEAVGCKGEPGMGASELRERYPNWHVDSSISDTGWWGRDYETREQAKSRADRVAFWMASELANQGGLRVFVIHADFKRLLIESLRLSPADGPLAPDEPFYNVSITQIEQVRERWIVHRFNCVKHLDGHLVSPTL